MAVAEFQDMRDAAIALAGNAQRIRRAGILADRIVVEEWGLRVQDLCLQLVERLNNLPIAESDHIVGTIKKDYKWIVRPDEDDG